jgi:hypothetical protein
MEREAAIVRFKVAAELYPFFEWQMIRWKKGAWETLHQY